MALIPQCMSNMFVKKADMTGDISLCKQFIYPCEFQVESLGGS